MQDFGGFRLLQHATDSMVWLNQTIPVGPCDEDDLQKLLVRYQEIGGVPWFEFFPALSPELPDMLSRAGLTSLHEMPVMTLARDQWIDVPFDHKARLANLSDYMEGMRSAAEAFGGEGEIDVESLSKSIESGQSIVAVAYREDQIVGMAQAIGTKEIRELAGIGIRPEWRRKGFAAAMIQCLLAKHFGSGGELAWLTPGDDGAESLYLKCGFVEISKQVCYGRV